MRKRPCRISALAIGLLLFATRITRAQRQPLPGEGHEIAVVPGIERLAGEDSSSHIPDVRQLLRGSFVPSSAHPPNAPSPPPTLTAQCSRRSSGKYIFEIFTDFGGITDRTFYPPWKPASDTELFPPSTEKVMITMNFYGYTHVNPVRRQWEIPVNTPGQYRYNTPGSGSRNMEDITFYLRFLLALPTLRLTLAQQSAEFLAAPLIEQLRHEPLCRASLLGTEAQ